jgi:multidrug efflux pump subunit AcrB
MQNKYVILFVFVLLTSCIPQPPPIPKKSQTVIEIITVYSGMNASYMEKQVSPPILKPLYTIDGIEKIKTSYKADTSIITILVKSGIDTNPVVVKIDEHLDTIKPYLPSGLRNGPRCRFKLTSDFLLF